jgi:broad specificity phosphatase PhoE
MSPFTTRVTPIFFLVLALELFFMSEDASGFSNPAVTVASKKDAIWSDAAIQTARQLTESSRQKLFQDGVMGLDREVTIKGERLDTPEMFLRNDDNNSKIIHFQRHGEGFHNVICATWRELTGKPVNLLSHDPKVNPMLREEVLDSPLTEVGRKQCLHCHDTASLLNPEIIIVSPLLRAIQSAELSWSAHRIPPNNSIPWVAHEGCREELGLLICNKRRNISEIQKVYPDIDFSLCLEDTDTLFIHDRHETAIEKTNRVYDFLQYIRQLPQKEIAVVGHSAWLFNMCNAVMDIDDESLASWFLTSEIRSMRVSFQDKKDKSAPLS